MTGKLESNYAEVLFDITSSEKLGKKAAEQIQIFANLLAQDESLTEVFSGFVLTKDEKFAALDKIAKKFEFNEIARNFLRVLIKQNRISNLSDIMAQYEELVKSGKNIVTAEVISSQKMSKNELDELKKLLENNYGKNFELHHKVDSSILGGMIIKMGSTIVDASIKGSVENLRKRFIERLSSL